MTKSGKNENWERISLGIITARLFQIAVISGKAERIINIGRKNQSTVIPVTLI